MCILLIYFLYFTGDSQSFAISSDLPIVPADENRGSPLIWASQKKNTDKRKYVILKYKYVGKKPLEDSNEKRTIRG